MPSKPPVFRPPGAPVQKFTYGGRWRKVRAKKLGRDPLCEDCRRTGATEVATEVHHVLPIEQGGAPYSLANLASLCRDCHAGRHKRDR